MMNIAGGELLGQALLTESLRRSDEATKAFSPRVTGIGASNGLGDRDGALQRLRAYMLDPHSSELWPIRIRNASEYGLIRQEPEFIEFVEDLEQNAALLTA